MPTKNPKISRRAVLKGSGALLAGAAFSTRVMASAPPPEPVTPALIEAAKKEGKIAYYTSTDLPVAPPSPPRVGPPPPPPEPVTPALIEAAKKEGKIAYYTSTDLPVAEKLA